MTGTPESVEAAIIGAPEFLADAGAAAAPEPQTWVLMTLGGDGGGGASLPPSKHRGRRRRLTKPFSA